MSEFLLKHTALLVITANHEIVRMLLKMSSCVLMQSAAYHDDSLCLQLRAGHRAQLGHGRAAEARRATHRSPAVVPVEGNTKTVQF